MPFDPDDIPPAAIGVPIIMCALTEYRTVLRRTAVLSTTAGQLFSWSRVRVAGREAVVAGCGVGKVNAAMATQAVLDRFRPPAIVVAGSAGSLCAEVRPGDVVIGERVVQHDAGINLGRRYAHLGVDVWGARGRSYQRTLDAPADLVALARAAAEELPAVHAGEARVHAGCIATGDQVIFSSQRKAAIWEAWGALAVEMESGAVAQVAQTNGVPWLLIRGISDGADENEGIDLSRLVSYAEDGATLRGWMRRQARRAGYLARHPDAPARMRRLVQGIQAAAGRAAEVAALVVGRL